MSNSTKDALVMLMFGYLGLGFPDIDLVFLSVLNHRSIVTHSILIPALFLAVRNSAVRHGACGFILGLSIHLSADVLSSPVGFGMVWLPWPIKAPLGPFSPLWLGANAIVGLVWAKMILLTLESWRPLRTYVAIAFVLGPSYAILHEKSFVPLLSFFCVFGVSFPVAKWLVTQAWFQKLPRSPPPLDASTRDPAR